MKAAKVSIKFERYCFQLNPSALKCTINNGTVVRNQNITFVIYAGCLTTLYGKRLTVPRFVRLLPLVPSAADAETYITRKNNAQILNIQVTGELGSENAAAWSLWKTICSIEKWGITGKTEKQSCRCCFYCPDFIFKDTEFCKIAKCKYRNIYCI